MTLHLESSTELKTEGLDLDQRVMLKTRIEYLGNHIHFQGFVNSDVLQPQFEATLVDGQVEIVPIGGQLPNPWFYSGGRDGKASVLDLQIEEDHYRVSLKDEMRPEYQSKTPFLRYILHKNPKE